MPDEDRDPLINPAWNEPYANGGRVSSDQKPMFNIPKRAVIVEPVFFLYTLSLIGSLSVIQEYLYARFAKDYPILANHTTTGNGTGPCGDVNVSDPYYIATQEVQKQTSNWNMYLTVLSSLLSVFTTLIYGAYSDTAGRRLAILAPSAASTIKFTLNCFIIYYDLPVPYLLIGQAIEGLGGGVSTIITAAAAYVADITTPKQRGLRLTILEGCIILSAAISQVTLGYFIRATNYFYPYLSLAVIMVLNLLYSIFFVPETVVRAPGGKISVVQSLKRTFYSFAETVNKRHVKLFLLTLSIALFTFPLQSRFSLIILYSLNVPLCWNSVQIGIYQGISALAIQIGAIIGLKLFKMCYVPEIWIAVIGCFSLIAGGLVNAWADSLFLMLMVVVASIFLLVSVPMYRSIISRLVRVDEQGKVFSGIACVEAVCTLLSAIVMNKIYQETLYIMRGFVFIVSAMFGVLTILVAVILVCMFDRHVTVPSEILVLDDQDDNAKQS